MRDIPLIVVAILAFVSPAIAQAASPSLPRVERITVDGDPADWAERGLRVDAMAELPVTRKPAASGDASLRLGWDDEGVVLLLDVADDSFVEAASDGQLWSADGVEFFVATGDGKQRAQFIVTPGLDAARTGPQSIAIVPGRAYKISPGWPGATKRSAAGYTMEARLPWDAVGLTAAPKVGDDVRVQVYVNDVDADVPGRRQFTLTPLTGASGDSAKMLPLRLAAADAKPEPLVIAAAAYERFRRLRVNVAMAPADAGKAVRVVDPEPLLAYDPKRIDAPVNLTVPTSGRAAAASVALPIPARPPGELQVHLDGKSVGVVVPLPDLAIGRAEAVERLGVAFAPSVFAKTEFPAVDFLDVGLAEDLIGPYDLSTTFYDASFTEVKTAEKPGRYGAIVTITPDVRAGPAGTSRPVGLEPITRFVTLFRSPNDVRWWNQRMPTTLTMPPGFGLDPAVVAERPRDIGDAVKAGFAELTSRGDAMAVLLAALHESKPTGEPNVDRTGAIATDEAYWYELKKRTGHLVPYQYAVTEPKGYADDATKKWPLILFLHGSGERGADLQKVFVHGPAKEARGGRDLPFVIVSPQCPRGAWWDVHQLKDLLDDVTTKYRIDPDRVYLTGLSMGGYGTWRTLAEYPERFAAAVPICGGGDTLDVGRFKDVPTWIIHGGRDEAVPVDESYRMIDALRSVHGRAKFTLYPDAGHDSWTATYADPKLYEWLLAQRRGQPAEPPATTAGTRPTEVR